MLARGCGDRHRTDWRTRFVDEPVDSQRMPLEACDALDFVHHRRLEIGKFMPAVSHATGERG